MSLTSIREKQEAVTLQQAAEGVFPETGAAPALTTCAPNLARTLSNVF